MLSVLLVTAPIYLLMGVGFFALRQGVFQRSDLQFLGRLLVVFFLPALVFRAINRNPIEAVLNPTYLGAYAVGSLLMMTAGVVYARRLRGYGMAGATFIGLGMAASNSAFVGYPILLQILGPQADTALAMSMLIENLLIFPVALTLANVQAQQAWHRALWQAFSVALRNPIVMAMLLGLLTAVLGWRVPEVIDRTLAIMAGAAAPLALFMTGGVLVGQKLQGVWRDLLAVIAGKLLLHPLLVALLLWALPPLPAPLMLAAIAFAAMPLPSIYPVLAQKYGHEGFCAAALVMVTAVSFVSLNFWLAVLPTFTGLSSANVLWP